MNFCSCENSRCICKTSCICIHRGCLCIECVDLRKKDCKECGLPSSYRELTESNTSGVASCKCEFSSQLQSSAHVICSQGSSAEVAKDSTKEPESGAPKIEPRAKELLQASSKQTVSTEQEMAPIQDIGTHKSYQPSVSSEYFSRKDSFSSKVSNQHEKQKYKSITFFEEKALISTDDSGSSSEEIPEAKEALDYLSPCSGHQHTKNNQLNFEKLSSDINSTSEQVQLPSSRSSSGISILELPDNELALSPEAERHFTGNLVAISSIQISPNQIHNLCLQRPESPTPTMMFGERTRDEESLGRSVSPIQIITTNPRTVLVSPSGRLHLLPLRNSQLLRPQVPASSVMYVSQSASLDNASSDSAVKILTDTSPKNIQSSGNSQKELRGKLSSTPESCASNSHDLESNTSTEN